jgi:hypothetical protein
MAETLRPLEIGNELQLLIDDHLVDDVWMIRRAPEMPIKHLDNPIFIDSPGGTIIYDQDDGCFKMWYGTPIPGAFEANGAYAISDDGIQWEKPTLGVFEHDGSKKNNYLGTDGFGSVMKDVHDPDPARRYKMMTKRRGTATSGGRAFAAFSHDGIHWVDYPGEKSIIRDSCDGNGMVLYDESIKKYVNFRRPTIRAGHNIERQAGDIGFPEDCVMRDAGGGRNQSPEGVGFPSDNDFVRHEEAEDYLHRYLRTAPYVDTRALRIYKQSDEGLGCNRRIARTQSDDFIHWTEPEVIIRPDELDPPRLYTMSVSKYCGVYFGLMQVYNSWGSRRFPGCPQESETIDIQLAFSRDGWTWERLANRPVFISRGYVGSFDGGMIGVSNPAFVEYRDEIRIYYSGNSGSHNVTNRAGALGVARLPRGRIVARVAGDETGALLTKPFRLDGDRLTVNANAASGLMKVELTDAIGKPIKGFSVDDAVEVRGDSFALPVEWTGERHLGELRGDAVRLRIYMYRTRLYSFQICTD